MKMSWEAKTAYNISILLNACPNITLFQMNVFEHPFVRYESYVPLNIRWREKKNRFFFSRFNRLNWQSYVENCSHLKVQITSVCVSGNRRKCRISTNFGFNLVKIRTFHTIRLPNGWIQFKRNTIRNLIVFTII